MRSILQYRSFNKSLKLRFGASCFYMFLFVLPVGVKHTKSDSSFTNLQFLFGRGDYAAIARGCEDNQAREKKQLAFSNIGLQVDRKLLPHLRLGIRGSYIFDESKNVTVINPFINLEWRYFALGAGYVYTNGGLAWGARYGQVPVGRVSPDASGYLRLGDKEKIYLSASLYHTAPSYSSSYFRIGFGGTASRRFNWWFGMGSGPYSDEIGIVEIGYQVNRNFTFKAGGGLSQVEGINQDMFNIGLQWRIPE